MTWKQWLAGLLAAMIGSVGTAIGAGVGGLALGYDIWDVSFREIILGGVVVNGLTAIALHIKQFPPPGTLRPQEHPWDGE